uniref:Uncharacterized protein n=1 Tax=Zea mays TaxID=4577 RepID=B4FV67_MAIZE|nr:unknown [Zea mays]
MGKPILRDGGNPADSAITRVTRKGIGLRFPEPGRGGRRRPLDEPPARRRRVGHRRLGQAELHALQLLRRRLALPAGLPRRVLPQLIHWFVCYPRSVRAVAVRPTQCPALPPRRFLASCSSSN